LTKRRGSTTREKRYRGARPRVFGALRGVVEVGEAFFQPLPIAELYAWSGRTKTFREPSLRAKLAAGLNAFWSLAITWRLSPAEQCALLSISRRTLSRWHAKPPVAKAAVKLDRLRLILLTHERLEAAFAPWHGTNSTVVAWYVRLPGTAHNPDRPNQTVLEALSERSVLAVLSNYHRLEERFRTAAISSQSPPPAAKGRPSHAKRRPRASPRPR
jgi:hypothetical protein